MSISNRFRMVVAAGATGLCASSGLAGGSCPADVNGDGVVDFMDLLELLDDWGACPGCPADLDGDGVVAGPDLAFMVESWGPCNGQPEPGKVELFTATAVVDATDGDAADLGWTVTHLYATGPEVIPGDALLLVDAADIDQLSATVVQHPVGTNLPPASALFPALPELRYDTFGAMNLLADDSGTAELPETTMDTGGIQGGWLAIPPGPQREAVDIGDLTGNPGQAGVLIAQVTLLCPGDANADGVIGTQDLLVLLALWGPCPLPCAADFDLDGQVGTTDLLLMLATFSGACHPGYQGTLRLYTSMEQGGSLEGVVAPVFFQR